MTRRPRRRALVLVCLGVTYVLVGLGLSLAPPVGDRLAVYAQLTRLLPLDAWAVAWVATGVCCLLAAPWRRAETPAFGGVAGLAVVWSSGLGAAWALDGAARGWLGAAQWGAVAALVLIVASWPDPPGPPPAPPPVVRGGDPG